MADHAFGRLPFAAVAGVVGAISLGVVILGVRLHWGIWSLGLLVIPGAIAAVYIRQYAEVAPAATPSTPGVAGDPTHEDEPFDDPVEEADRLATEDRARAEAEELPSPAETSTDPPAEDA